MEIALVAASSNIGEALDENDPMLEFNILNSIKSDVKIVAIGKEYVFEGVSLIQFYFELQESILDALVRGINSSIRENFEDFILIVPTDSGCDLEEIRPPYPVEALHHLARERFDISCIRSVVSDIEGMIRDECRLYREEIFAIFDRTQSPTLFKLLKIIDKSRIVRS